MEVLRITSMADVLYESAFAILIVFCALTLLVLAFYAVAKITRMSTQKKLVKEGKTIEEVKNIGNIPANEVAAISLALHLFLDDVHDDESNVITIKRIERRYSPWSSKIYGLTNLNR